MVKKIKDRRKNASDTKQTGKKYHEENNTHKKKRIENKNKIKDKPSMVMNRNIKFKSKSKKKLTNTIKSIQKLKQNNSVPAIVDSKKMKNKSGEQLSQRKKSELFLASKEKPQSNVVKHKSNKQTNIKNHSSTRFNSKFNKNENILKDQKSRKPKHKLKQKKKLNNKLKCLNSSLEKQKEQKKVMLSSTVQETNTNSKLSVSGNNLDIKRLRELLVIKGKEKRKEKEDLKPQSLRERMLTKLRASRFRYLNETLYNNDSSESKKYFKNDPDAFKAYHEGYKQQIEQWPLNPLDIIISSIKKMPKEHIIADFGCGDARLAASVPHKVHSFDFVSLNENVTVCDVTHTPLLTNSVHVVVFCLSLMGSNLKDYIVEASRVLKVDGIIKVAEVESRFEKVEDFIKSMSAYGYKNTWKDLSHNLFYFLDFKKENDLPFKRDKLPPIILNPCLYKRR